MDRADFLKTLSVGAGLLLGGAPPIEAGEKPKKRDIEIQDAPAPYQYFEIKQGKFAPVYQRKIHVGNLPKGRTRHIKHHIDDIDVIANVCGIEMHGDNILPLVETDVRVTKRNLIVQSKSKVPDKEALIFIHYTKKGEIRRGMPKM